MTSGEAAEEAEEFVALTKVVGMRDNRRGATLT